MNESDPRSNVHYLGSSGNRAWKKIQACTGFEPMTAAIPVQRSTNWANKPTGSRPGKLPNLNTGACFAHPGSKKKILKKEEYKTI